MFAGGSYLMVQRYQHDLVAWNALGVEEQQRAIGLERMLQNMVIGDPPGTYDRILDFSTAVTGCLFFVPAASLLDELADGAG